MRRPTTRAIRGTAIRPIKSPPHRVPVQPSPPPLQPQVFSQAGYLPQHNIARPEPVPFQAEPIGGEITIEVCQGLGDIFWVYQKFAPYFDSINFNVLIIENSDLQKRSLNWLNVFPKVHAVSSVLCSNDYYSRLSQSYSTMEDTVEKWRQRGIASYCCNRWLEDGVRIDEIDPGSLVAWDVPVKIEPYQLPFEDYVILYVSGSTMNGNLQNDPKYMIWNIDKWVNFLLRTREVLGYRLPVVLLAANFDRHITEELDRKLRAFQIETHMMIQRNPTEVLDAIQRCKLFLGYQSGLNIMADNLNVPQIMLMFECNKLVSYAWCKQDNLKTKFFAYPFSMTPDAICLDRAKYPL